MSYDKNKKKSPIEKLLKIEQGKIAVYDPTVNITGFLKQAEQQFDIELIAITGDFLTIKQQILNRGGRITKSLYSRWRRILALSKKAKFTGIEFPGLFNCTPKSGAIKCLFFVV